MYKYEKIKLDDKLPIKLIDLFLENNNYKIDKHWHNSIEILVPVIGRLDVWLNGKSYWVDEGEVFIINSKEVHNVIWVKNTEIYKGYALQINYEFIKKYYNQIDSIYFK